MVFWGCKAKTDVVPNSCAGLGIASASFGGPSLKLPGSKTLDQAKTCVKQCLKPGKSCIKRCRYTYEVLLSPLTLAGHLPTDYH